MLCGSAPPRDPSSLLAIRWEVAPSRDHCGFEISPPNPRMAESCLPMLGVVPETIFSQGHLRLRPLHSTQASLQYSLRWLGGTARLAPTPAYNLWFERRIDPDESRSPSAREVVGGRSQPSTCATHAPSGAVALALGRWRSFRKETQFACHRSSLGGAILNTFFAIGEALVSLATTLIYHKVGR